jgi:glucose-6-phosphate isomerase
LYCTLIRKSGWQSAQHPVETFLLVMTETMERTAWDNFQELYSEFSAIGLCTDLSRSGLDRKFFDGMAAPLQKAFAEMDALESGAIANPDEKRMVGHYWLRNAALAPNSEIRAEIQDTISSIKTFAHEIHSGAIRGEQGTFSNLLVIGIGGSALGPQFVAKALGNPATDRMAVYFFDNTDPDGMDKVLAEIGANLGRTLTVVISKSGGTKETRNGMLEVRHAYERAGLHFERHAVAITGKGSELSKVAEKGQWIKEFPMWDWVGGRTSETSAVGLLPAALQGLDIEQLLQGAAACDAITRKHSFNENPAAQLAAAWFGIGQGKGSRDMVVLPYKDRLELFSKYLQQLIMESLGKERDRDGKVVNQGIAVYGNKGSTDQHAYVQQLRDGLNNFFVTFIQVLEDRPGKSIQVDPGTTSGDYLQGFLFGTREALSQSGRLSITLTIDRVDAFHVGVLIALYERAVGLYASLININAYHQPDVEAGKKAATSILQLQSVVYEYLSKNSLKSFTAVEIARALQKPDFAELIFRICQHLAANKQISLESRAGVNSKYRVII